MHIGVVHTMNCGIKNNTMFLLFLETLALAEDFFLISQVLGLINCPDFLFGVSSASIK